MKKVIQSVLRQYKRWVSPALPAACRYVPSCSEYAMEAVERHGAARGSALAAWRVLRCHPLAKGGYDPVPEEWSVGSGQWSEKKETAAGTAAATSAPAGQDRACWRPHSAGETPAVQR